MAICHQTSARRCKKMTNSAMVATALGLHMLLAASAAEDVAEEATGPNILFFSDNGCSGELGHFGTNWGKHTRANYHEWRKRGGWSISQGQCWAAYSNTPLRKYKKFVHEGGIASPLIAHWPAGIKQPGRICR